MNAHTTEVDSIFMSKPATVIGVIEEALQPAN
jgi:hypothetical protein